MKKRFLSILLALCLVLTVLPLTASAADLTTLYIGSNAAVTLPSTDGYYTYGTNSGGAGTASNQETLPADGWTWAVQYNAGALTKYTLTLNNAVITTNYSTTRNLMAAIYAEGDLNVVLLGVNTVTGLDDPIIGGGSSGSSSSGVYVLGSLTIGGSGYLTASAGKAAFAMSGGVFATENITITDATITAIGGYGGSSFGLRTNSNSGDSIAISGGTVTAIGSDGDSSSYGIRTTSISITGGIVTAYGDAALQEFFVEDWVIALLSLMKESGTCDIIFPSISLTAQKRAFGISITAFAFLPAPRYLRISLRTSIRLHHTTAQLLWSGWNSANLPTVTATCII